MTERREYTTERRISIIVAMSENRVIGRDGGLPWHLPDDLRRFRRLTTGHAVIMGRRTYESIGRPLPQRCNVVVTRRADFAAEGVLVAHGVDEAVRLSKADEIFIIGGAELYRETLGVADRLLLTIVHAEIHGDVQFPEFDPADWRLEEWRRHEADDEHAFAFTHFVYQARRHEGT